MANAFGMVYESLWRNDKDFRALSRAAQCTFVQLLSQRDMDWAGVQTLNVGLLMKGCSELTADDIWHDLKTLEAARFVYVDADTDELLIRSYLRRISARSPNLMKNALKVVRNVASPKLRHVLAQELRRIGTSTAIATADEIEPVHPVGNPSGTLREPFGNPSGTIPEGLNPSERVPGTPFSSLVLSQASPTVVGSVGGARASASAPDTAADSRNGATAPPPQEIGDSRKTANDPPAACRKHPAGWNHNEACTACGRLRKHAEAQRDAEAEIEQRRARERAEWERGIHRCPIPCPDSGMIFRPGPHPGDPKRDSLYVHCPHDRRALDQLLHEHQLTVGGDQ